MKPVCSLCIHHPTCDLEQKFKSICDKYRSLGFEGPDVENKLNDEYSIKANYSYGSGMDGSLPLGVCFFASQLYLGDEVLETSVSASIEECYLQHLKYLAENCSDNRFMLQNDLIED